MYFPQHLFIYRAKRVDVLKDKEGHAHSKTSYPILVVHAISPQEARCEAQQLVKEAQKKVDETCIALSLEKCVEIRKEVQK